MSELLNVSKHIVGIYRLVECKDKKMTPDELQEIAEMARKAEKIYYRLEENYER
jgi:hypothetical protein